MITPIRIMLRRIVNTFLSANIVLATEEQAAIFAKSDPPTQSEPFSEIGRILHDILLVEEKIAVRWERRVRPIIQWSPWGAENRRPDFAWLAESLHERFERTPSRSMVILRPTEMLERIRKCPRPSFEIADKKQAFRYLALTDAFLKWDEYELNDDVAQPVWRHAPRPIADDP